MADQELTTRDLAGAADPQADNGETESDRDRLDRSAADRAPTETEEPSETVRGVAARANEETPIESDDSALTGGRDQAATAGHEHDRSEPVQPPADSAAASTEHEPLLPEDQSDRFTTRWQEIQASFVDEPRESVEQADALVADLMQRLAASFSNERERLEAQWDRGDEDVPRAVEFRWRSAGGFSHVVVTSTSWRS